MTPVAVPEITARQDARTAAADARKALREANGRLSDSNTWYSELRKEMAR